MSIIPAFEIGLWNAWIFMLLILSPFPLVALFRKGVFKKTASIHASVLTEMENKVFIFSKVMYVISLYLLYFLTVRIRDDMVFYRSTYLLIGIYFADDCLGECCY